MLARQAKIIRTTMRVAQGGAEVLQPAGREERTSPWKGEQPPEPGASETSFFKIAKVEVLFVHLVLSAAI